MKGLLSKETAELHWWASGTRKLGIKRVDKGHPKEITKLASRDLNLP